MGLWRQNSATFMRSMEVDFGSVHSEEMDAKNEAVSGGTLGVDFENVFFAAT